MKKKVIPGIRAFNRWYTDWIGLLDQDLLNSGWSLAEARLIYEIHAGQPVQASKLTAALSIDKGYLSRIIRQFEKRKFIKRERSSEDTRVIFLTLTAEGKKEFLSLDKTQDEQVRSILKGISEKDLARLLGSMAEIKRILTLK